MAKFKNDLAKLITTLDKSNRHYIRCIKPNDTKAYHHWEATKVYEQLSCNGVHETVTLRKAGYPNRVPFDRFLARYGFRRNGSFFFCSRVISFFMHTLCARYSPVKIFSLYGRSTRNQRRHRGISS